MKKYIRARLAANILLVALGLLAIFHVLVALHAFPEGIVWNGRGGDSTTLLEWSSFLVTLLFGWIIAARIGYVQVGRMARAVAIATWIVFAFFVLNTLGNLTSPNATERFVFAPVAIILALLALRLAMER